MGILIITILKCITLFCEINLLTYLTMAKGKLPIEFLNTTKLASVWFNMCLTGLLSIPIFVLLVVALFKKSSLCVRFSLTVMYMIESIVVMVLPVFLARSLVIAEEWVLLAVTAVGILILYPVRILMVWTVRGFYRELSFIMHNKAVEEAEIEEWKGKLRFCDECVEKYGKDNLFDYDDMISDR